MKKSGNLISLLATTALILTGCSATTKKVEKSTNIYDYLVTNVKYTENGKSENRKVQYDFKNKIVYYDSVNNDTSYTNVILPTMYGLDHSMENVSILLPNFYLDTNSKKFMDNFDYICNKEESYKLERDSGSISYIEYADDNDAAYLSEKIEFKKDKMTKATSWTSQGELSWSNKYTYQNGILRKLDSENYDSSSHLETSYITNDNNQITSYKETELTDNEVERKASFKYSDGKISKINISRYDDDGTAKYLLSYKYNAKGLVNELSVKYDSGEYKLEFDYNSIEEEKKKNTDLSDKISDLDFNIDKKTKSNEKTVDDETEEKNSTENEYVNVTRSDLVNNESSYLNKKISFNGYYFGEALWQLALSETPNLPITKRKNAVIGEYEYDSVADKQIDEIYKPDADGRISHYYGKHVCIKGTYKGMRKGDGIIYCGLIRVDTTDTNFPFIDIESIEEI